MCLSHRDDPMSVVPPSAAGMSYPVSHGVHERNMWQPPDGYTNVEGSILPHGYSVVLGAPAAMRYTASASPDRHMEAALLLGGDAGGARLDDAGDVLAARLVHLMKLAGTPSGLGELGFTLDDLDTLVQGDQSHYSCTISGFFLGYLIFPLFCQVPYAKREWFTLPPRR
jgi:hypothetical protein